MSTLGLFESGWGLLNSALKTTSTVTRTPYGHSGYTLEALTQGPRSVPEEPGEGRRQTQRMSVKVAADNAGVVSYPPDTRDTFTIGGVVWVVDLNGVVQHEASWEYLLVRQDQHRAGGAPVRTET